MTTPLMHPGWIAFNEQKWNLTAHRFRSGSDEADAASLEAVLYANAAGKLRPVPHNIYCPVTFSGTSTDYRHRRARQWLDASTELANHMQETGLGGAVSLNLPVDDARPWQWHGFRVEILYTSLLEFPFDVHSASSAVRKAINKGKRAGYTCARTTDVTAVMSCITATEQRQGFSQGLSVNDLQSLLTSMGEDHFRMYLCLAPSGQPASAEIVLHTATSYAIDWIAGTESAHLSPGSKQVLMSFILEDLRAAGATGIDLGGANLPRIAAAKAEWGGRLMTFYSIREKNLRSLAQDGRQWISTRFPS